jgi:hypothetical protein
MSGRLAVHKARQEVAAVVAAIETTPESKHKAHRRARARKRVMAAAAGGGAVAGRGPSGGLAPGEEAPSRLAELGPGDLGRRPGGDTGPGCPCGDVAGVVAVAPPRQSTQPRRVMVWLLGAGRRAAERRPDRAPSAAVAGRAAAIPDGGRGAVGCGQLRPDRRCRNGVAPSAAVLRGRCAADRCGPRSSAALARQQPTRGGATNSWALRRSVAWAVDLGRCARREGSEPPTARSVAWCSASIWSAPDGSGLLTLEASSIWSDPVGSRRIVWMIKPRIKQGGHTRRI